MKRFSTVPVSKPESFFLFLGVIVSFALTSMTAFAQNSGSVNGRVVDPRGDVMVDASVKLINELTQVTRHTQTTSAGDFVFEDVLPGKFSLIVDAPGFKQVVIQGLELSSAERLSAGTIGLQVGQVSQSVTVEAATTPVQTTSAEVSGLLDTKQLDNLLAVGRDFMAMVRTVPGVVEGGGATSLGTSTTPTINGIRSVNNSGNVDGVGGGPRGGDKIDTPPNLDAIQEVKVLTSSYQAEFGAGTAGPVINVVTKSGTQAFHGSTYYYVRNEAFNANSWFNNYTNQPRARYRYNDVGGNLGGPVFWPNHFNTNRNKLFFFVSGEYLPNKAPEGLKYYTVPTQQERNGDFSQSYAQGKTNPNPATDGINIKMPGASSSTCPTTGTAGDHSGCFAGNVLPGSSINPQMQALLNLMPLPNFSNLAVSAGNYNYITNYSADSPVNQEIFKIDYDPSEKLHMFFRGEFMTVNDDAFSSPANKLPWLMRVNYQTTHPNLAYDITYAFTPSLLNELTVGTSGFGENQLYSNSDLQKATKNASGYDIGQLYPSINPLNLLPAVTFGGVTNAATFGWDSRFPMYDRTREYTLNDNMTKIIGSHNTKFGINLATDHYLQAHSSSGIPEGSFSYNRDVSNPNDSNYAWSNALEGLFDNYTEPTARSDYNPRIYIIEWFAQDQWKVTPRFTLDYGLRFAWVHPPTLKVGANFVPGFYQAGKAPVLYQPEKVGGKTVAVDPTTNQTYPAAYVGLFVPNTGSVTDGAITTKSAGTPEGLVYGTGLQLGPRFGFAFDPHGNGKSAIRGGFGVFINPATQIGQEGDMTHNPPNEFTPQQFYGDVNTFLNAGTLLGPPNFGASFVLHPQEMKVYGASLQVQQDVGFGTVVTVGYVGNVARHMTGQRNINEVPNGAHFLPQNQSPAGGVLPDNFFRPYPGYATITYRTTDLDSSYHSLQAQVTRRFKDGLEFGLAYTWSRAMDVTDSYDGSVATYEPLRIWNYGPAGWDHRNILVVNYLYSLPKASRVWSNVITRGVLDNWQISGFGSFQSGAPNTITFSTKDNVDLTGGGDGARVFLSGDPMQGAPRKFKEYFNTSVVQRPSQSTYDASTGVLTLSNGVSPYHPIFGPGNWDFDTALFKNVLVREKFALQFRLETYNTFNTPEFNGVQNAATFSAAGVETDSTFGQINTSNGPRVLQLAGRINF